MPTSFIQAEKKEYDDWGGGIKMESVLPLLLIFIIALFTKNNLLAPRPQ